MSDDPDDRYSRDKSQLQKINKKYVEGCVKQFMAVETKNQGIQ